ERARSWLVSPPIMNIAAASNDCGPYIPHAIGDSKSLPEPVGAGEIRSQARGRAYREEPRKVRTPDCGNRAELANSSRSGLFQSPARKIIETRRRCSTVQPLRSHSLIFVRAFRGSSLGDRRLAASLADSGDEIHNK